MPKRSRSGVRQQPGARGRADQRERRQLERHDARAGALPDGDRQALVLHRRIERLLQRARQAVDLIDEEHAARLERGQKRGDVSLALERRPGGLHERHVELGGDDLRERGLAQAGRPGEQQMVERVPARARPPRSRPRAARAASPGRRTPPAGAGAASGRARPRASRYGRLDAGRLGHAHARPARRAAPGDQLLGAVALGVAQQLARPRRARSRARAAPRGPASAVPLAAPGASDLGPSAGARS